MYDAENVEIKFSRLRKHLNCNKFTKDEVRACPHEPETVNYPWVMIAPGQALPHVHMMICCPGSTSLPRGKFIVI